MSNWVGGLPLTPKAGEGGKKKGNKKTESPPSDDGHPSRLFFGGAIPPTPLKMPKVSPEDLKPPKISFVGGPPAPPKPPPPPPPKAPPPPPPPPPPSPISPRESEPSPPPSPPPPSLPVRLPSVFDKKPKKKRKKRKKKPPPPPPKTPVYEEEEEEEEPKFGPGSKIPSIFAISHVPATRQGYPPDEDSYKKADTSPSPRSRDSEDEGPKIPPEVPSYKRANPFAAIWGKLIDARNITEVGPHGWHPTSNAPYDVTDDGETVTVDSGGWHEPRSE